MKGTRRTDIVTAVPRWRTEAILHIQRSQGDVYEGIIFPGQSLLVGCSKRAGCTEGFWRAFRAEGQLKVRG